MAVDKKTVLDALSRIKGPNLDGNIVALRLVSEILIKDDIVYFSITVPPDRAAELEPLRQAAQKVVSALPGVAGATVVLTADVSGAQRAAKPPLPLLAVDLAESNPSRRVSLSHRRL